MQGGGAWFLPHWQESDKILAVKKTHHLDYWDKCFKFPANHFFLQETNFLSLGASHLPISWHHLLWSSWCYSVFILGVESPRILNNINNKVVHPAEGKRNRGKKRITSCRTTYMLSAKWNFGVPFCCTMRPNSSSGWLYSQGGLEEAKQEWLPYLLTSLFFIFKNLTEAWDCTVN